MDINRWTREEDVPRQDSEAEADRAFGSAHSDGCHYAFCDGSVKTLSYTIDYVTYRLLGHRKDGQPISEDAF